MVNHLTDEQLRKMYRGGHDSKKGLCRLQGRDGVQGPADGHPGQDDQGLRPGRGGRGPQHFASARKKMNEKELREFRARFNIPDERRGHRGNARSIGRPRRAWSMQVPLRARRKALGGFLPKRSDQAPAPLKVPALADFARFLKGDEKSAASHDHEGVRAACSASLLRNKDNRAPHRADHSR